MSVPPCMRRVQSDLRELAKAGLDAEGIHFCTDADNCLKVFVVITGADGTPYANCPLLMEFEFGDMYPMMPPKAKFCTGDGQTRFNPNLYVDGKICLSILGTWQGPSWTPVMTLTTIINSICALVMNEEPLRNEPGWEQASKQDIDEYNQVVEYRSLCVGLVQQLRNLHQNFMPMREQMVERFRRDYGKIMERVRQRKAELDGRFVKPRYGTAWKLDYTQLEKDLVELGKELGVEQPAAEERSSQEATEGSSQPVVVERPKPKDVDLGTEWEANGKRYVCAENARGIKFWKVLK